MRRPPQGTAGKATGNIPSNNTVTDSEAQAEDVEAVQKDEYGQAELTLQRTEATIGTAMMAITRTRSQAQAGEAVALFRARLTHKKLTNKLTRMPQRMLVTY